MDDAALDLAIATAPRARRSALETLFALDRRLASVVRSTTEGMIGRIRLAWWREALVRLDTAPPPAEPLLAGIADRLSPLGIRGSELAIMTDAWDVILAGDLTGPDLTQAAERRGIVLFTAATQVLGASVPAEAGAGWALADFADRLSGTPAAAAAGRLARELLVAAFAHHYAPPSRPLGVLALLAAFSLRGDPRPVRDTISLIGFRLTGRHRLEIGGEDDSLAP